MEKTTKILYYYSDGTKITYTCLEDITETLNSHISISLKKVIELKSDSYIMGYRIINVEG